VLARTPALPCIKVPPFATDERVEVDGLDPSAFRAWPSTDVSITDPDGTTWRPVPDGLAAESEAEARFFTAETHPLGGREVRDLALDSAGTLWMATDRGVTLFDRRDGWRTLRGSDGMPIEDVRRVLLRGNGERWFATPRGVVRLADGRWSLFAGRRWLPEDDTVGLAVVRSDTVAVLCRSGVTVGIRTRTTTLREKADAIEATIRARHCRLGYVSDSRLAGPGDTSGHSYEASDNDGLWTAIYLAAEAFRFAVTGEPEARAFAAESMEALLRLEEVTGISGFPARAVVGVDEPNVTRSGGEWHQSPCGRWLWKGDTSSDELNGHYFALPVYYELVADTGEKVRIRQVVRRITDHLIEHDFRLIDVDGRPTRWAVFTPQALNQSAQWGLERGLNSLSMLSFLKVAHAVCGDERYANALDFLVRRHHYALNTIDQKIMLPGEVNHSDDELSFLAYYPLFMYENDPDLLALYRLSMERTARCELPERNPLWNFMASVTLARPVGLSDSVRSLMEIPVDRVRWAVDNRDRADVAQAWLPERGGNVEGTSVLPYSENGMTKWNGDPYELARGGDGTTEDDGAAYLLPYWLGRFHGLIED